MYTYTSNHYALCPKQTISKSIQVLSDSNILIKHHYNKNIMLNTNR